MDNSYALDLMLANSETVGDIKKAMAGGKLPHALLICGPDGCGRGFMARLIAADFLYPPEKSDKSEKRNRAVKAVLKKRGSEVIYLTGQGVSGQIPVDSVREARQNVYQSSLSAAGRVVLIPDAHKMTQGAANALLKVLEEPPAHALFVLSAPGPSSLPATITSRCALYRLSPLEDNVCRQALAAYLRDKGIDLNAEDTEMLPLLYGSRLGLCIKAAKDAEKLKVVKDAIELAQGAANKSRYAMLRVFSRYEGRGEEERSKRDFLLQNFEGILSAGLLRTARKPLPVIEGEDAAAFLPHVSGARIALYQNSAPKITFTALTANISREFA